jgi:hypothetical protein
VAVTDLLSDKQLLVPVEQRLFGPHSQFGCFEEETNVFSAPAIKPGFLGRLTCVLTAALTAVCLYSYLGFGQMRDRILHPCQTLKVKLYLHFVYTFPSSRFLFKEKKLETLEILSSGKNHPPEWKLC